MHGFCAGCVKKKHKGSSTRITTNFLPDRGSNGKKRVGDRGRQQSPVLLGEGRPVLPSDVRVRLDVSSVGCWEVSGHGCARVPAGPTHPVDCVVRCDLADLVDIASGRLDPRRAFLDGRLQMEGDIGLALRLQAALRAPAA